jgi:hypothetical protein
VPPDYAYPRGATVQIAVVEHPATDPAHRIGSLFFNPAGSPAATHAKFTTLLARLADTPVDLAGFTFTQALTVGVVVNLLYEVQPLADVSSGWPGAATVLQNLWLRTSGVDIPITTALSTMDLTAPELGVLPSDDDVLYAGRESELGVLCSDAKAGTWETGSASVIDS